MDFPLLPGIYADVSHDAYHADPCAAPSLSAHVAHELVKHSPGHAWRIHPKLGGEYQKRSSAAMDVGTVIHGLILGSGPEIVAVDAADWRTKAAQQAKADAEEAGKVAMLKGKLEVVRAAANKIRETLPFNVAQARTETTLVWESLGATCRARVDSLFPDWWIWDLKFCEDATVSAAERNIVGNGYHIQAASNIDGVVTIVPEASGRVRFGLCFVEWENPEIGIIRREIRGQLLDLGKQRWNRAKSTWARCLTESKWPGYSAEIEEAPCPAWAVNDEFKNQIAAAGEQPF